MFFKMNWIFLKLLLSLLVLEYISRGKYFVLSAWNQSCVDNMCSCCVDKQCGLIFGFSNGCLKGCIDGHWGARCYEMCTSNCKSCNINIDTCTTCHDGFYLGPQKDCTLKCPPTCKTCSSNSYCDTCKEGFYDKDGSTTCKYSICPTNCECDTTNCVACKNGFYDKDNYCNKTCPPHCLACTSLEHCSKCQNGFYNGIGPNGDISPRLNDCTYKCRETCTICSSYENCLKCAAGKYGLLCQENCSVGCNDNICLIQTGKCNCTSNFSGEKCTNCVAGKYGNMCENNCPRNCKNDICHRLSGNCTEGCDTDTLSGANCDKCIPGRYGTLCENICPENCENRKCNKDDGKCSDGCEHNFVGTTCVECIYGRYGDKCQYTCPDTCVDHMCKKQSGDCYECTNKFDGNKCDTCKHGFHGSMCDKNCSNNCLYNSCHKFTGVCKNGCETNYSGDKCCVKNNNCMQCISNTECRKCKAGYFNFFCKNRCPTNCLDSCDISTGFCKDCILNHFGSNCTSTCSENCRSANSSDIRKCSAYDGTCVFGCEDGYFGALCNERCSRLCINGVCFRDSGICVEGCTGSNNNPVCGHGSGKSQAVSVANSTVAVLAVLATLLVVASVVIGFFIWVIVVKKIRSADRQPTESFAQVHFENTFVEEQRTHSEYQTAVSDADNITYEVLDKTEVSEHAYDLPKPKALHSPDSAGHKVYENMKV